MSLPPTKQPCRSQGLARRKPLITWHFEWSFVAATTLLIGGVLLIRFLKRAAAHPSDPDQLSPIFGGLDHADGGGAMDSPST
jgi:hypothetical protein